MTLKPEKRNKQKTPFAMFKNNPLFFINFLFFCLHTVFVLQLLCFSENTIKKCFQKKKTQLFKNTVSKTHFFTHVKNTFFQKKVSFLVLGTFRCIFIVFPGLHCFGQKHFLAKTDRVYENARFSPFLTQIMSGYSCKKKSLFYFFTFLDDHLKKHYFIEFFWPFPFFLSFLCSISPT